MAKVDSNLYLHLTSLGDIVPLDFTINVKTLNQELEQFNNDWKQYNPRKDFGRDALALTSLNGEMAGINLDSLREYNLENGTNYKEADFATRTKVANECKTLHPLLDMFDTMGRSHILKLRKGGFFPPHRDGKISEVSSFRVLVMLDKCTSKDMVFLLEDQRIHMEIGRPYVINTRKLHSVFSFVEGSMQCVLNIPLTNENYKAVCKHFREK